VQGISNVIFKMLMWQSRMHFVQAHFSNAQAAITVFEGARCSFRADPLQVILLDAKVLWVTALEDRHSTPA
jgi:hypothetical protein